MGNSSPSAVSRPSPSKSVRDPNQMGFGVFETITSGLNLLKPGLELSDHDTLTEIKQLCMKIYRSTNMRYQNIAKLILRNKYDELRK
jgi:hypothetical protein